MKLDVVVVAYKSRAHLRASVEPLVGAIGVEVLVIDNACPERSAETIDDLPISVIHMGRNVGFAAGCNAGAQAGTGDAILFLNPDATISREDLRRLASVLERDPTCAIVGPHIIGDDGNTHYSMRHAPRLRTALAEALFLHHAFRRASWASEFVRNGYDRPNIAAWLSGSVLLVRRDAFEQLAGFDERFFMYSEDTDLCVRALTRGFAVRYESAATARHVGGASAPAPQQAARKATSRIQFARIHEQGIRYLVFRLTFAIHEILRVPLAASRSREHVRGRFAAFVAAVATRPVPPDADRPNRQRSRGLDATERPDELVRGLPQK